MQVITQYQRKGLTLSTAKTRSERAKFGTASYAALSAVSVIYIYKIIKHCAEFSSLTSCV